MRRKRVCDVELIFDGNLWIVLAAKRRDLETAVEAGTLTAPAAVDALLALMGLAANTSPRA